MYYHRISTFRQPNCNGPGDVTELVTNVNPLDAAVEHEVGELVDGAEVPDEGAAVAKQHH